MFVFYFIYKLEKKIFWYANFKDLNILFKFFPKLLIKMIKNSFFSLIIDIENKIRNN